jgi:putative glycosyltransferase
MGMDLSIVATLYQSASYIPEFHRRVSAAAQKAGYAETEIVFVNDGSPDRSLEVAVDLQKSDPRLKVVDLSRNFGHHKAMMTGLAHTTGKHVFLIDTDLEEAPELLESFAAEMRKTSADVVFGQQESRRGDWFERVSGEIFYKLLNLLSSTALPENVLTARLMTRRYVDSLLLNRDQEVFIPGLWTITGFEQRAVKCVKTSKGSSTYTFGKKMAVFVNAVTSFSSKPLVYIFYLGVVISMLSILAGCYLVIRRIFFGDFLVGWPSLIVSIWFLGGLTILSLGVIAIYLSKVFMETKDRPYTIVRKIYGGGGDSSI